MMIRSGHLHIPSGGGGGSAASTGFGETKTESIPANSTKSIEILDTNLNVAADATYRLVGNSTGKYQTGDMELFFDGSNAHVTYDLNYDEAIGYLENVDFQANLNGNMLELNIENNESEELNFAYEVNKISG